MNENIKNKVNSMKISVMNKKYIILSALTVVLLLVGSYYGYNYYENYKKETIAKEKMSKLKLEKEEEDKKTKELEEKKKNETILKQQKEIELKKTKELVKKEPKEEQKIINENLSINNNALVSNSPIERKNDIKEIIKTSIKNSGNESEAVIDKLSELGEDVNVIKDQMNKSLTVLEDTNKENINEISKNISILNKQIEVLSESIKIINDNYLKQNKTLNENETFITSEELKIYFNQNNERINEILTSKFSEIDKKLDNLHKNQRVLTLNNKVNSNKKENLKTGNYNVETISNIEFEYIGYDIITKNNTKEKIAYITKTGTEKIYTLSLETEIENKYVLKDLDSEYLYIKMLSDNKIYKLKILE